MLLVHANTSYTGNLETLETRPKARGVDTLAELIKFYEAHYSSNLMCLVIYGKGISYDLYEGPLWNPSFSFSLSSSMRD